MILKIILLCCVLVLCDAEYEGDSCAQNGRRGTCVRIGQCEAAILAVQRRINPQICGFVGAEPIVCCLDTAGNTDQNFFIPGLTTTKRPAVHTNNYEPPDYEYTNIESRISECQPIPAATAKKTGQKAFDKCLEYQERFIYPCEKAVAFLAEPTRASNCHHNADELIIGGDAAAKHEFPHMVMLRYGDGELEQQYLCGGAIISERFILTAGHCAATSTSINVSHVIVGVLTKREVQNVYHKHEVKRIIKHPEYAPPVRYHDIALLETKKAIKLSQYVVPACLHVGDPVDDERVLATGWGVTDRRGSMPDVLQKVILQKFPTKACADIYLPHRHLKRGIDQQIQMCYGDRKEAKDTCYGDSGGPIQIKSKKIHCTYTVVGVTSIGKGCGFVGEPAIYTRLAPYIPWIESIVWP